MAKGFAGVWFSQENGLYLLPVLMIVVYCILNRKRNGNAKYPPCRSGFIPWLGCAIEFGKAPLYFIDEAKKKMGPIFTLKVAGKRMTFLTDPEDFKYFFNSADVDFQKAVQVPVQNTANIPAESFFKNHTKIHDTVKWKLAPNHLKPFHKSLSHKFVHHIQNWGSSGCADLNLLVRSSMYKSVIDNLFGDQVLPTEPEDAFDLLEKHFVTFDDQFEYGCQLPELFLRDWSFSKHWLLKLMRDTVQTLQTDQLPNKSQDQTLLQSLIGNLEGSTKHNFSLLFLWASLANAIPITFWTLAFVISHPKVYKQLKEEVQIVLGSKERAVFYCIIPLRTYLYDSSPESPVSVEDPGPDSRQDPDGIEITEEDLQRLPGVKRALLEAIRLRSPGVITRMVTKEFTVKEFTVPTGDMLMMSPYWSHMNPTFFPHPEEYIPDRWLNADLDKNVFLEGFVAFGGGRYQCPGRWFALLEIHIYVALAIHMFDFQLIGDIPANSPLHLVGTQQPVRPCTVEFTRRPGIA